MFNAFIDLSRPRSERGVSGEEAKARSFCDELHLTDEQTDIIVKLARLKSVSSSDIHNEVSNLSSALNSIGNNEGIVITISGNSLTGNNAPTTRGDIRVTYNRIRDTITRIDYYT